MKLFQIKTQPLYVERIQEFLQDNYICMGCTGIGDLDNVDREEIRRRLIQNGADQGRELEADLESLELFVHNMQDGDYVLMADEQWAYLGDLGDYFYDEASDNPEDGRCHRRGVTWLKSVPFAELNPSVRDWMTGEVLVSQYTGPLPGAKLDLWITGLSGEDNTNGDKAGKVDEETLAEALAVLKTALYSEDAERRERAAIAILQYAK
ncbi:hypothetical protein [Paenibacillus sp. HW567]|uniref:hypothetical protein n=1 Tax=Paenibacillus sp. HW567 TaxID=1034769 RepID=UPI00036717A9|nr:hypothetical protein [Paenibacillus sp. HW567]